MKSVLLFYLFIVIEKIYSYSYSYQPTQNHDADAAYLSYKIYDGVNSLNSNSGCVIKSDDSGRYAVWKHYRTKECYVVIRGTKNLNDFFTDLDTEEYNDEELGVKVHNGVRLRTEYIINNIDDKLKECKRDIIITGHSLGGSVSHYLFLKYVKKHFFNWGQKMKAYRFKAVIFGAPQLITRSNNQFLIQRENSINWYKYENDLVPELISTVKKSFSLKALMFLLKYAYQRNVQVTTKAYNAVKDASYGFYIPGHKYHLLRNGIKKPYRYQHNTNLDILDHIFIVKTVNAITKNGWGKESPAWDGDTVNCLNMDYMKMDYIKFLNEEENMVTENYSKMAYNTNDNGEIDINTVECENLNNYIEEAKFEDVILYFNNGGSSYIIKRLLDSLKEYEYAICIDNKFVLKQCDANCKCHEVKKNDRPKEIEQCTSYQPDSTMNCLIDGTPKEIELKDYFSLIGQTKIGDYYLMDYICNNQIFERGNYKNSQNINKKYSLILILSFLIILF